MRETTLAVITLSGALGALFIGDVTIASRKALQTLIRRTFVLNRKLLDAYLRKQIRQGL